MTDSADNGAQEKPLWLLQSPTSLGDVVPPTETKPAELPFGNLTWQDFERLCLRLARQEGEAEHWQQYGTPGQAQAGIDILVRQPGAQYDTWQSKRYEEATPTLVKKAGDEFLKHKWAKKSSRFFLCIACSIERTEVADQIVETGEKFEAKDIEFNPLGSAQLSERFREYPRIVDEFFGRAWVEYFCGREAAESLSESLGAEDAIILRKELSTLYRSHFDLLDPGVLLASGLYPAGQHPLGLRDRYVEPSLEVDEQVEVAVLGQGDSASDANGSGSPEASETSEQSSSVQLQAFKVRHRALERLAAGQRNVVLGEPGAGKSSLLRFIALDILSENPRSEALMRAWANFLPIWVPFGLWTRLVRDDPASGSLVGVVERWFTTLSESDRVWKLVHDALTKGQVLLLVDGLDEWVNEQSARTAANLLQTFAASRDIPVIVTSRPLGFSRLQQFDATWHSAALPGLDDVQRKTFTENWFLHHEASLHNKSSDELDEAELRLACHKADEFLRELATRPGLVDLSRNPLLLWGLISVGISEIQLPRSRIRAYQELTRLMLHLHPGRRLTAALAGEDARELSETTERKALAALAYELHENRAEGAIDTESAISVVADFLIEDIGFARADAANHATILLSGATTSLGILVERAPNTIGFFHRSFQEFLASDHLSGKPFDVQLSVVEKCSSSPVWFDVIYALLHHLGRPSEVDQLIEVIERVAGSDSSNTESSLLLAEAAFGEQLCSPATARRLAKQAFARIESGSVDKSTKQLLALAVGGLNSDLVKTEVEVAIDRWFPRRFDWLTYVYKAVSQWPFAEDVERFLIRGISEENESNRREAAAALAVCGARLDGVRDELVSIIKSPGHPAAFYGAVEALLLGWPAHGVLGKALGSDHGRSDYRLELLAIKYRVARGEQTNRDLETLLDLASDRVLGMYLWRDDIIECFLQGWPNNEEVIKRSVSTRQYGQRQIDHEIAIGVLLGSAANPDAQSALRESIRSGDISISHRMRIWQEIGEIEPAGTFSAEIDHMLSTKEKTVLMDADAAAASGSDWSREFLIFFLNMGSHSAANAADALMDRWGVKDEKVASALRDSVGKSLDASLAVAPYVADILDDPAAGRKILFDLMSECEVVNIHRIIRGLQRLGVGGDDDEAMDRLFQFEFNSDEGPLSNAASTLIEAFPENSRVQDVARNELRRRNGAISAIAEAYRDHPEFREEILSLNSGIRRELRLSLVERLGREAVNKEFPVNTLAKYDFEDNWAVKSLASIEFHRNARATPDALAGAADELRDRLHVIGPDMDPRRAAAVLGLLALERVDVFRDEVDYNDKPLCIDAIGDRRSESHPAILQFIAENWSEIESALGDQGLDRLSKWSGGRLRQLALLAPFSEASSSLEGRIKSELEGDIPADIPSELLRWVARQPSKKNQLLDLCSGVLSHTLDGFNLYEASAAITAGVSIGEAFRGDPVVQSMVESELSETSNRLRKNGYLMALCSGWPDSKVLDEIFETYKRSSPRDLLIPASIALVCAKGHNEVVCNWLYEVLLSSEEGTWKFMPESLQYILRRMRNDETLIERMNADVQFEPTPDRKATIPRLIVAATGARDDLTEWCLNELNEDREVAEIGFDALFGGRRLVRDSLLEVVGRLN